MTANRRLRDERANSRGMYPGAGSWKPPPPPPPGPPSNSRRPPPPPTPPNAAWTWLNLFDAWLNVLIAEPAPGMCCWANAPTPCGIKTELYSGRPGTKIHQRRFAGANDEAKQARKRLDARPWAPWPSWSAS